MSLSTFRAVDSCRRASTSGRELSALVLESFLSSSPPSTTTHSYFQSNDDLHRVRRGGYSAPSISRDSTTSNYRSRANPWRRGYAASSMTTAAGESSFELVSSTVANALVHVQMHSGLPWWATLGATACIVRISMLPLVSRQMHASVLIAHATSVLQGKKKHEAERLANNDAASVNNVPEKASLSSDISETLRIANAIRKRLQDGSTAPHPYWLLAAPMIQLPTFVCAISGVRNLIAKASNDVASGHQSALYADLSNGGMIWFRDLTLSGLDLTNLYAPMGMYGVILPSLTAAMVFANIDLNFGKIASANPRGIQASIKLLLEWMCVPILIVGMQLPQAVHCYWLAGSTYSYLQSSAIRSEIGKKSKILGTADLERELKKLSQRGVDSAIALDNNTTLAYSENEERVLDSPSPKLSKDMEDVLVRAAELKASGKAIEACREIEKLLLANNEEDRNASDGQINNTSRIDTSRGHPSLWYALAQTRASMKNWKHAAAAYEASARLEPDASKRGKALFGAGISRGKLNDVVKAVDALQEAHNLLPKDVSIMIALASSHKMNGDSDTALAVLKSAAREKPEIHKAYVEPLERELEQNRNEL
jgi:membrane protein insertase Oxa1/YidC/SpoIIIJ